MNAGAALPSAAGDFTVDTKSIEPRCNNFRDAEEQAAFFAMIGKIQQRFLE
jgi:hypothetical protein